MTQSATRTKKKENLAGHSGNRDMRPGKFRAYAAGFPL